MVVVFNSSVLLYCDVLGSEKRHRVSRGESNDLLLLNWPSSSSSHSPWRALSKESLKYKSDGYLSSQEEPLNFCLSSLGGSKAQHVDPPWDVCSGAGLRVGPGTGYLPGKLSKCGHAGRSGAFCLSPSFSHGGGHRGEVSHSKLYDNLQAPSMEGYCVDGGKVEGRYMAHDECYNGMLVPEMAIKTEQDSDSENGCHTFGAPHHSSIWPTSERRYGVGVTYPEGPQVKNESSFYEHYTPCQRGKAGISPPLNRHHKYLYASSSSGSGKPLKCVLNKDALDPLSSSQGANCVDGHMYPNGMAEHKAYMQQDYKLYEFRGRGLVHAIKREPMDSPPWSEGNHDLSQIQAQRNIMANCTMNTIVHKSNPYIYLQ